MNEREIFSRSIGLIGQEGYEKLKNARVAVFGVGGVGGFVCEALCRSGVGTLALFDDDKVALSNFNRQIIATTETFGKDKLEAVRARLVSINPAVNVICNRVFYLPETADAYDLSGFDYVIDAVDTVSAKIEIIKSAKAVGVPVISSMGTGGKLDPLKLKVGDVSETRVCPLARVMRRELKKRNIFGVKVVYSVEEQSANMNEKKRDGRGAPPSMICVPATAGLVIASEVIKDILRAK